MKHDLAKAHPSRTPLCGRAARHRTPIQADSSVQSLSQAWQHTNQAQERSASRIWPGEIQATTDPVQSHRAVPHRRDQRTTR
jgi:hypothetical protein